MKDHVTLSACRRILQLPELMRWITLGLCGGVVVDLLAADLTVTRIEVTQAIQTPANAVRLVAQRSTAVRATVGVTGAGAAVPNVSGRLHVFVNGVEITPVAGLTPINAPFTAPLVPDSANQNDTLNFEMPSPSGITASTDVDVQVDINPIAGESNTANNSLRAENLVCVDRLNPLFYYTRINYTLSGLGLPADALIQQGVGDMMMRGLFPVNDGDPTLYRQGPFPSLTFSQDLETTTGEDNLKALLESCRQLIVDSGVGANCRIFLYGWLAGNPITYNGSSIAPGNVSYGNTEAIRFQRTYAHELTHNFLGAGHGGNNIDQIGWDVGARLQGNPVGNAIPNPGGRVKPTSLFDIREGGLETAEAWVRVSRYNEFLDASCFVRDEDRGETGDMRTNVYVIQGILTPDGQEVRRFGPVLQLPWLVQPSRQTNDGTRSYAVQLVGVQGAILSSIPFSGVSAEDVKDPVPRFGFFSVAAAAPGQQIFEVRVANPNGDIIRRITRSETPPEVLVLEPQEGSPLGESTTIRWEVSDRDTPDRELTLQVAYSPDNGRSWSPIAVNLPGELRAFTFDSREIQKSDGRGVLRVFVSDGLNTSYTDVRGLTPVAAVYPPASEVPQISLTQQRGSSIVLGFVTRRGQRYSIQSSRGLSEWESVKNVNGDGTLFVFSEPIAGARRFYRIRQE